MNYYLWDPSRLIPRQYKDKQQNKRYIKIKQVFGKGEKSWPNDTLHLTAIPLRSIAADELCRNTLIQIKCPAVPCNYLP